MPYEGDEDPQEKLDIPELKRWNDRLEQPDIELETLQELDILLGGARQENEARLRTLLQTCPGGPEAARSIRHGDLDGLLAAARAHLPELPGGNAIWEGKRLKTPEQLCEEEELKATVLHLYRTLNNDASVRRKAMKKWTYHEYTSRNSGKKITVRYKVEKHGKEGEFFHAESIGPNGETLKTDMIRL